MKRAFTLVEMVVVITIMAVLTHLAVREVAHFRDEKTFAAANRQLCEIDGAVRAFAADMGRLPRSLDELWKLPAGAIRSRLVDASTVDREVPTNRVVIAAGWKGPYLKLPIGRSALYDAWGNELSTEVSNGVVVAVGHLGMNGLRDAGDCAERYDRDVTVRFDGLDGGDDLAGCTLAVSLDLTERESVPEVIRCKLFWSREDGLGEATNLYVGVMTTGGLTPGEKVLWETAGDAAHAITVRPGANDRILKIR